MTSVSRAYVSRLAGLTVFDPNGDRMGKVRDVVVALRVGTACPRVLGLVVEVVGARLRFTHPLLASAVYQRTPLTRRRELHATLATIVPIDVITLIGGAVITEAVFARPGMGQLFVESLRGAEIEPVMAYLLITAALAIVANIVADIVYAVVDPRIRLDA